MRGNQTNCSNSRSHFCEVLNNSFSSLLRIPSDWTRLGRVDPTDELELTFALKQRNVDLLEQTLRLVSDPESALYGRATSHHYAALK